jgi:hypothetical protein
VQHHPIGKALWPTRLSRQYHFRCDRKTWPEHLDRALARIEADAHGNALNNLREVARAGLEGKQRETRTRAWREALDRPMKGRAAEGIDIDGHGLADAHAGGLGFLEIGGHVQFVERHQGQQPRTRLDVVPDADPKPGPPLPPIGRSVVAGSRKRCSGWRPPRPALLGAEMRYSRDHKAIKTAQNKAAPTRGLTRR